MIRRTPPEGAGVVPGSTPVVAFGDPDRARVATLGLNPSRREFLDRHGRLLDGSERRLATLASLRAVRLEDLGDKQVAEVITDCAGYFRRHPYRRWFDPLDRLLQSAAAASYYDSTACHFDLVQWATNPVWGPDRRSGSAARADRGRAAASTRAPGQRKELAAGGVQRPPGHRPGDRSGPR